MNEKTEAIMIESLAVIEHDEAQKHEGSTRVKAIYNIYEVERKFSGDLYFSVRKSGAFGTGYGGVNFSLLGSDTENKIVEIKKGFSVGADPIKGVADKDQTWRFTFLGNKWNEVSVIVFGLDPTKDNIGLPSREDWERLLGTSLQRYVADMVIGGAKEVGNWIIKKIK